MSAVWNRLLMLSSRYWQVIRMEAQDESIYGKFWTTRTDQCLVSIHIVSSVDSYFGSNVRSFGMVEKPLLVQVILHAHIFAAPLYISRYLKAHHSGSNLLRLSSRLCKSGLQVVVRSGSSTTSSRPRTCQACPTRAICVITT